MSDLLSQLEGLIALVESGQTLEALERYYAVDVLVRENRQLSRAGRAQCLEFERQQLAQQQRPARIQCLRKGVDPASDCSFIEWKIRTLAPDGHVMLLEEVAVQTWQQGQITEERFYYSGAVDEGPAEGEF